MLNALEERVYLALLKLLQTLDSSCNALVHVSEGERAVPTLTCC